MIVALPVVKTSDRILLYPHFGRTPYIAYVDVRDREYKVISIEENPYARVEGGGKGKAILNQLLSKRVEAVIVLSIGYGMFQHLKTTGITVYRLRIENRIPSLEEALELFINGQVEKVSEHDVERGHHGHH